MPNPAPCPLCRSSATFDPITADRFAWKCPRCGNYSIVGSAESVLGATPIQSPGAVSGWIRRQNSTGVIPNIRSDDVARLRALTKPPFRERVERYLLAAADKAGRLDARVKVGLEEFIGVSYSDHVNELVVIIDYLRQEGLLTNDLTDTERVTARGYIAADELRSKRAASTQAFVAMWLNEDMQQVYTDGLEPGIRNAGFRAMLIPKKAHAHSSSSRCDPEGCGKAYTAWIDLLSPQLARSCRFRMSALRSLWRVKRTRYAQCEFFAFWTQLGH
jgi:hypothetical protein